MSLKIDVVNELHKPVRKKFQRRRTIIKGLNDLFQADLIEFIPYARLNKGHKYILLVINCFSKYVWTRPLKSKSGVEVTSSFESIIKTLKGNVPINLQVDAGKEFWNKQFQNLCKTYNINLYSTYTTIKAAIAERAIRTIKNLLYKDFSLRGKYKWTDILQEVTSKYNNSPHSAIGGINPSKVNKSNEKKILKSFYSHPKLIPKYRFKVGDIVRISKYKHIFSKGYTPNWTTELFKVVKINITNPVTYQLEDSTGQPILGGFYEQELQKTKHKDVFLVEKILRRKQNKLYVQWLGLSKEHNSWINKQDFV